MLVVLDRDDAAIARQWAEREAVAGSDRRSFGRWAEVEPRLAPAVEREVAALRDVEPAERLRLGREAAEILPFGGEQLLFHADPEATEALARVLAVLAYQPLGVVAFGRRWIVEGTGELRPWRNVRDLRRTYLLRLIGPEGALHSGLLGEYAVRGWDRFELDYDLRDLQHAGVLQRDRDGLRLWRRVTS